MLNSNIKIVTVVGDDFTATACILNPPCEERCHIGQHEFRMYSPTCPAGGPCRCHYCYHGQKGQPITILSFPYACCAICTLRTSDFGHT